MPNVLQIGATVNVAELKAGMEEAAAVTRGKAGEMSASFQQLAAEAAASTTQIASNWVDVAQASLAFGAAQAEVRSATKAAKDAEEGDTAALARLALAKRQAALASEALSGAIKTATVGAVEEEGVLAGLTERLVGTAEAANLAKGGMAGFAGIAGLLGGGVLLGFFGHFEDELAKSVVELDHLATNTGIDIQVLAGLQQVVREAGGDFDGFRTGLGKMLRAQESAVSGNKKTAEAFGHLGISIKDLESLQPEELLFRIAAGVENVSSSAVLADASTAVFGKGWQAVIPVLRENGAALEALVLKAGEASGVTEKTAAAAREWTKDTAELGQMLRWLGVEILSPLLTVVNALGFGFEVLGGVTAIVARTLIQPFAAAAQGAQDLSVVLRDTLRGDVAAVQTDVERMKANWTASWKAGTDDIEGYLRRLKADRDAMFFAPPPDQKKQKTLDVPEASAKDSPDSKLEDIEIRNKEAHALALLEIERKSYEEDAKLRGESALVVEAHLLAFNDRELKIKQDAIAQLKALDKQKKADERDATLSGQDTAAADQAALKRVEIDAHAQAQLLRQLTEGEEAKQRVLHAVTEAQQRDAANASAAARKDLEERERDMREELSFEEGTNTRALEAALKMDNDRLKHHQMTARQWEDAEIAAVEQWQARAIEILEKEANQELAINGRKTTEYQRIKDREIQIEQQAADRIAQIQQQEYDKFSQMFQRMGNMLTRSLGQWLTGHETFAKAMQQVYAQMVESIISNLVKWVAQELAAMLTHKLIAQQGIASDAASAAASAFRWVMNEVPFPVNAVLAPIAAAGAFAGVMAFGSFEQGGMVPGRGPVPIIGHGGEMYLGHSLTERVLNVVNAGAGASGGGRGGHTINMSPTFVVNHPMTRADLDEHMDYLASGMRARVNRFNS
jgi:hypothetical protein